MPSFDDEHGRLLSDLTAFRVGQRDCGACAKASAYSKPGIDLPTIPGQVWRLGTSRPPELLVAQLLAAGEQVDAAGLAEDRVAKVVERRLVVERVLLPAAESAAQPSVAAVALSQTASLQCLCSSSEAAGGLAIGSRARFGSTLPEQIRGSRVVCHVSQDVSTSTYEVH